LGKLFEATKNGLNRLWMCLFQDFFRFFANRSANSEQGKVLVTESQGGVSGFAGLIEFDVSSDKNGASFGLRCTQLLGAEESLLL
jgi:hypothetical protein